MSDQTADGQPGLLARPPFLGIFAYLTVLLYLPLGHTLLVLMQTPWGGEGPEYAAMSFVMGAVGVALMWFGLEKGEATATWLGFAAGILIWIGWFEFTWHFFSHAMHVDPITNLDGSTALSSGLVLMQATVYIFVALFIFMIANKDSRCRMIMWLHRNLGIRPGKPTHGFKRPFSRIVAMEMVLVTWFCYLANLALYDPRILGVEHPVTYAVFFGFFIWSFYLIYKLSKQRRFSPALRYAIPTTNISWLCVEVSGRWGLYDEIWVKPMEYALEMAIIFGAFIIAVIFILMTPDRSSKAKVQPAE